MWSKQWRIVVLFVLFVAFSWTVPQQALAQAEEPDGATEAPEAGDAEAAEAESEGDEARGADETVAEESGDEGAEADGAGDEPSAEDESLQEARRRFMQGVALARTGNCDSAIAEFNASLALVRRPVTIYNIAQCQERLHRYDLALEAYREYLDEAPEDDPDRASVETTIRLLGTLLGRLLIASNVEAEVWIGERQIGLAPGEVPVPSGRHVVQLRAEGYLPAQQEIELAGGQQITLEFTLEEARREVTIHEHTTETTRLHPAYFWTSTGAAFAAAAVAVGLGAWALSLRGEQREIDARLRVQEDLDQIDQAAVLTDVFWGIAGGFAIAAIILGVLTDWGEDETSVPATAGIRIAPAAAGLGLALEGWL